MSFRIVSWDPDLVPHFCEGDLARITKNPVMEPFWGHIAGNAQGHQLRKACDRLVNIATHFRMGFVPRAGNVF